MDASDLQSGVAWMGLGMTVTLETIHEDILSLKREFGGVVSYFEEDKMELSEDIKKQIDDSCKTPIFEMLTQEEV